MFVRDVLALKGSVVISIGPSDTIEALCKLLREKRIGAAIVSSDGRSIEGVISERDVAYGLAVHGAELIMRRVSDLMTKTVITCKPDDRVSIVASTMLSRNIRHLPVEVNGFAVGMVSIRDVLNFRVVDLQQQTAQLRVLANRTDGPPQDRE
jgi:CBS domain-containing protein